MLRETMAQHDIGAKSSPVRVIRHKFWFLCFLSVLYHFKKGTLSPLASVSSYVAWGQ